MPYFVYKITPGVTPLIKNLDYIEEFPSYREARKLTRELRGQATPDAEDSVKMIFAESRLMAEELLQEKREKPVLKEWEK